jgi:TM2 domain-containing membrane protein YozV
MRIYRDRLLDNKIILLLNRVMKSWFYSFSDYMNVHFTDRSIIYRGI